MELTKKEMQLIEDRRARQAKREQINLARLIVGAQQKADDEGRVGPFKYKGHIAVSVLRPDGIGHDVTVWKAGRQIVADLSVLNEPEAPAVEQTGAPKKRGRKAKATPDVVEQPA